MVDIGIKELKELLSNGKVKVGDVELILRKSPDDEALMVTKIAKASGNSARIYIPVSWTGKRIAAINLG